MAKAKSDKSRRTNQQQARPSAEAPSAVKRSADRSAKAGAAQAEHRPASKAKTAAAPLRLPLADDRKQREALAQFENALQFLSENHFQKARSLLDRLAQTAPTRELADRARVYMRICDQRLAKPSVHLKTAEDYYHYAVGLANEGKPDEAEQHLRKALKLAPDSDYLYYALATTCAQRDDVERALENLQKAIDLNEKNRYQAQNDSDFANLLEDPRFTELLYPEKPLP